MGETTLELKFPDLLGGPGAPTINIGGPLAPLATPVPTPLVDLVGSAIP